MNRAVGSQGAPASAPTARAIEACCAILYGDPTIELILGESLHPGGLAATDTLLHDARLDPGSRLLDLGCGTGASTWLAASMPGVEVTGLDTSEAALRTARSRGTAREIARGAAAGPSNEAASRPVSPMFVRGSASDLPFPDASFDAVLAECVLSTLDKERALAEIHRVLVPGGVLLLSDMTASPQGSVPHESVHPLLAAALCLSGAWRPDEVATTLASSGFIATPVSPSIVSGRVVATIANSSESSIGYLMYVRVPWRSLCSTSSSDKTV